MAPFDGSLYLSVFAIALLGGGHCFGMCGGVAALAGLSRAPIYHLGRIVGYGLIGAGAGTFGRSVYAVIDRYPEFALIGALLFFFSLSIQFLRVWVGEGRFPRLSANRWSLPFATAPYRTRMSRAWGPFGYGLATSLIPCGWFASFGWLAAASGSPVKGALVFASLWAGSLPALTAAAAAAGVLRKRLSGARFRKASAVLLLVLSVLSLNSRFVGYAAQAKAPDVGPTCGAH